MGYAECGFIMESRTGRDSSGLGYSPGMRRQTLKSSPFCPPSTSSLTQSIIKDHMMSHYKKVYSAKAAIDTSVPKSLTHSIKYNDQVRQDRLKKGRPQSAHSLSQRNTRASCSSAQSRLSVQYDDSPYLCSRSSMVSSPRFSTSFHAKEVVYPSYNVVSKNHSHHTRPASEIRYRSSEAALHRKQSTWSLGASGVQNCYKTFQDPVQKTYSGDLLQKHSQHFTKDKPFTPKTLKSEKTSYLSQYRYYRAPLKKPTQDCNNSRLMRQETYHGSTKIREYSQEFDEPTQGFNTEFEGSDSELNGTYFVAPRQESRAKESREHYLFDSSSRALSDNGKSPVMMSVSAEEEELLYLEFISAVTEDILSRGHISDRVLDRVINRHIDMNRGQLDEGKMRHLLDVLRKDFEKPINMSTSSSELEKKEKDLLDTLLPQLESEDKEMKTKEDNDLLPYASLIEYCDTPDYSDFLSGFTTLGSSKSTASPTKTNKKDEEGDTEKKLFGSLSFSELITNNAETSEDGFHANQTVTSATSKEITDESNEYTEYTTLINDEEFHQDQADLSNEGQLKELEDLEKGFSESLHISNNAGSNTVEPANEQHIDVAASVSDDDF